MQENQMTKRKTNTVKQMAKINDFAIKIANANGTGSASANSMLTQVIFRMGIPVSGKNVFPSNIQGLPTWYEIRVNKDGYTARIEKFDLCIAMNAETYVKDVAELAPGGHLLYDSTWSVRKEFTRDDIDYIGIPLSQICNDNFDGARARILMKNITYVGAVAALLNIDMEVVNVLLKENFAKKGALLEMNYKAIKLGYDYAQENFDCPLNIQFDKMNGTDGYFMIEGNQAAALGCVYAGATVGAWYPITPSTSLMDSFKSYCNKFRKDPDTGKNNYCIIQAEDELAAIGMVLGANWNGARSFTPTSGPGISLMSEFIGYAYYAEVPAVLFDVQRTGPATGMPTRTQQGDILTCAFASHGDTKHLLLFPANPEEAFYFAADSFDIADKYQTPVFVLLDLDIGMNTWMCKNLEWDDSRKPNRGKVLTKEEIEKLDKFHRYLDKDGDGICARTLPGVHPKGSYFTRGSGHDKWGRYTEDGDAYKEVVDRLTHKIQGATRDLPAPLIEQSQGAEIGLVTVGSGHEAVREAKAQLEAQGLKVSYMRIRSFPFNDEVEQFLESHECNYIIEQNRDGQLKTLLTLETDTSKKKLKSILNYSGSPLSSSHIIDQYSCLTGADK
jgi:2-oxoglutarate/2-oxoacid ferredoxin oxidoreductase subunit alpha